MPNHISNILKVHGSDESVKAVFNHIKGEEGQPIDFNKIIECPLELNIEEGFDTYTGLKAALFQLDEFNFREFKNEYDKVRQWNELRAKNSLFNGKCALRNIVKYDAATWYKWRIKNWGTKWNAYDIQMIDDYTIKFDTAWSGVPSLIETLSAMFPDATLEYCYADEDAGCNTFRGAFRNGEAETYYPDDNSEDAWDVFFETHEGYRDMMEFVDGTWKYKKRINKVKEL